MKRQIDIQFKRGIGIKITKVWFELLVNRALDFEKIENSIELSIVLTDKKTIRYLNKVYRQNDNYTDVLAFSMNWHLFKNCSQSFIFPPTGINYLGEVFICYPVAVQQALKHKHVIEKELALLTIHGILHLLGYDHEKYRERKSMRNRELEILNSICQGLSKDDISTQESTTKY